MSDVSVLYARLALRPDADEKEVRRAYARELRKIDQATQPEAFQELREAYDQLLWRLRQAQQIAQAEEPGEEQAQAGEASLPATTPANAQARPPEQPATASPQVEASQAHLAQSEKLARECLDELTGRMQRGAFERHDDVLTFLTRCLEDRRLGAVDARQYFEWGVASILASGWRPGHELLLAPAMEVFGWSTDRSRLQWLGRPGVIVDAAIDEIAVFDSQASEHRAVQKEVIRAMRTTERPRTGELTRSLAIAGYAATAFPHWLHIVSRPQAIAQWREWEQAIPAWRRKLSAMRVRKVAPAAAAAPRWDGSPVIGWGFWLFLVLGGSAKLLSWTPGSTDPPPVRASISTPPLWDKRDPLQAPATGAPWEPVRPVISPEMQALKDRMYRDSLASVQAPAVQPTPERARPAGKPLVLRGPEPKAPVQTMPQPIPMPPPIPPSIPQRPATKPPPSLYDLTTPARDLGNIENPYALPAVKLAPERK